ncbi:MAG TPA: nucleoside-triphosphatase [bacterium]|nr:nucleoside-triphosphatase [bacterium]
MLPAVAAVGRRTVPSAVWCEAAVLAGLWASCEIVVGSFLHNLNFPLCGHIMTGIAIIIMAAGHGLRPRPGVLWRAGLLCAVMKSVSPSAAILPPMIAIFMEGVLMELGVRLLRARLPGYLLGGGLAMSWTLLHKVGGLLIHYGFGVAELYVQLYRYAEKQLGVTFGGPWVPILLIWLLLLLLGAAAAVIGWTVARRAAALERLPLPEDGEIALPALPVPAAASTAQQFSLWLLAAGVAVVAVGPYAVSGLSLGWAAALVAGLLALCRVRYPQMFDRLKRPGFWFGLLAMSLLAGLFLGGGTAGTLSLPGLMRGGEMCLRAVLMVAGFAVISVELANPRVRRWLIRRGAATFMTMLEAAFSILPLVIAVLPAPRLLLCHPVRSMIELLRRTDGWLEHLRRTIGGRVHIIAGAANAGKTTLLQAVIDELRCRQVPLAGVVSPGLLADGVKTGFAVVNIADGTRAALCRRDGDPAWPGIGAYRFDPRGLAFGRAALSPAAVAAAAVVAIDEVGRWELDGGGWAEALTRLTAEYDGVLLLAIRESFVAEIVARWQLSVARVWTVPGADAAAIARTIAEGIAGESAAVPAA